MASHKLLKWFPNGIEDYLVSGNNDAPPFDIREISSINEGKRIIDETLQSFNNEEQYLRYGIALLQLHIQDNYTGPPLKCISLQSLEIVNKECLMYLSVSGEKASPTLRSPILLVLAEHILLNPSSPQSLIWLHWKVRCLSRHRHAIGGVLAAEIEQKEREIWEAIWNSEEETEDDELLLLERAVWLCETGRHSDAWSLLEQSAQNMQVEMTGRLGRRTKYQTFDVPQLVVDIVGIPSTTTTNNTNTTTTATLPSSVLLGDDNILIEGGPSPLHSAPLVNLTSTQQLALLIRARCVLKKGARDSHSVVLAMPYVEACIKSPHTDYTVFTAALWLRSVLELESTRTRDRAVLQLDALVEQWALPCEGLEASKRLTYVYGTLLPPRHALRLQVADGYASLGAVSTAAEVYKQLECYGPLLRCYIASSRKAEALEICKDRLAKDATDWECWCIMGDLTDELQHYHTAWKGSGKRFALAARCLARRYVGQPEVSIKWWRRAVRVNVAHAPSQFALGVALLHQGITMEAVGCFAACVHLIPDDAASWANLSAALQACDKIPQALVAAQHAVRHSNRDARMWDNLAQLAMQQGAVHDVARACSVLVEQLGKLPLAALSWLVEWSGEWRNSVVTVQTLLDAAILKHAEQPRLYALRCQWAMRQAQWDTAILDAERHTRLLRRQLESDETVWEELCRALVVHADLIVAHKVGDARAFVMSMRSLLKTQQEKWGSSPWYTKMQETLAQVEGQ